MPHQPKLNTTTRERDVLRRLADEVAALSQRPRERETIELWQALNGLRPRRPMLWITEIPWGEIEDAVEELRLVCADSDCRNIERRLRQILFTTRHLPCDEVVEGVWWVPKAIEGADYGLPCSETQIAQGESYISSHAYKPVIACEADICKIRMPEVRHNAQETDRRVGFAEKLFGDILPIRPHGVRQHFFPAWDQIVRWTGVTEALMDLIERPDYIHAIVRRMTDATLARIDQLEEAGLLDYPHPLARVGSGAAGYTDELPQPDFNPDRIRPIDQWGGATPQIFSDVSPEMHAEFALRYENEVMSRCGLNYYGCCEPVHHKMDLLAEVPRLRKISISPWCDVAMAAAKAGRTYVFSHKPNPAILAEDRFNVKRAEEELRTRLALSGPMPCEFIMKDISTIRGDARRLIEWCEMAWRVVNEAAD